MHRTHTMSFRDYTRTGDSPREEKKIVKNENTCSACAELVSGDLHPSTACTTLPYHYETPIRRHAIQLSPAANDGRLIAPKGCRGFFQAEPQGKQPTAALAFALNLAAVLPKHKGGEKNGYYHLSSVLLPIIHSITFFTLIHSHLLSSFRECEFF